MPGETEWKVYAAGEVFNVPGNSEFHLQVAEANLLSVPLSVSQRDARRLPLVVFPSCPAGKGKRRLALRFAAEPFHQALDQGSQLAGH
ncbi:pyrimidine/purine nucleoside phosphorylase [Klebsiella pneumoniae subsp. pneumoniae]|nr:pyrimidine/purine nucleoside phosphorylase [Klebsiella pneumoniae subsp. pneumoniae]